MTSPTRISFRTLRFTGAVAILAATMTIGGCTFTSDNYPWLSYYLEDDKDFDDRRLKGFPSYAYSQYMRWNGGDLESITYRHSLFMQRLGSNPGRFHVREDRTYDLYALLMDDAQLYAFLTDDEYAYAVLDQFMAEEPPAAGSLVSLGPTFAGITPGTGS